MEKCPDCNHPIYKTKRVTLNWLDVFIGLIVALLVFCGFIKLFQTGFFTSGGFGKLFVYALLAVISLVGWVFSRKVRKQYFEVQSCTRCDFKIITEVFEK